MWWRFREWRQRTRKQHAEVAEALAIRDWAFATELRIRSNLPNVVNEKRAMLVRITIAQLHDAYKYSGAGTVGEYFTFGGFQGEFEVYLAPDTTKGNYDE
jgi:hypothetical protein